MGDRISVPEKTTMDHAEEWFREQKIPIFPRCTIIAEKMYCIWASYAFYYIGNNDHYLEVMYG